MAGKVFLNLSDERFMTYVEADIRFLENRLDVISHWPASGRKHAVAEAISRRLTAIAQSSLARPGVEHVMAASCRLLDEVFAAANRQD